MEVNGEKILRVEKLFFVFELESMVNEKNMKYFQEIFHIDDTTSIKSPSKNSNIVSSLYYIGKGIIDKVYRIA